MNNINYDAESIAEWLMNKNGEGATDEQFLAVFKKMEQIFTERKYSTYNNTCGFYNWLKDTNEEIQNLIEERDKSSCRACAKIVIKKSDIKKSDLTLSMKGDSLDLYRREYNKIVSDFFTRYR